MPKSVSGFTGLLDIPTDYQAHHRLPQQLADNPFLKQLNGIVDLKDFGTNGIPLPKDVTTGLATGQTPHLGSHPAYTDFIEGLLDTATSNYDPNVPLTPSQLTEFGGRVNAIQAYSRMALSGLLPDSNVTPDGRVPLNSRDPMISSGDPAEVRAFYNQLNGDLQSKGFTTPESLDRLVDFPRYELLNQANAFDPNLTAAQRSDLMRNVDDVRASLDASGRTDLTSALDDAARGRYTLNRSTQPAAPTGASPELLQGVESATGRSFATGLMAPESLDTIGSSDVAPLQSVTPRDAAPLPQTEQPSLLPEQPSLSPDTAPLIQDNPIVADSPSTAPNTTTELPETRAPNIADVPELGSAQPDTTAPLDLSQAPSPARESASVADLPKASASELPAQIDGAATGRFTPNFVGVIGQSPAASKIFTGAGVLGTVGLAADAGLTGYNAYQMYNQGDTLGAGHEVAGFGGRLGGSLSGAYLLGEAGALGGPWGALGGAIVGGIGGAILGDKGVKSLYDSITGYQPLAAAAEPTPAWPDQFGAEFDRNNGGGPFSDPMTGFQTESQADYDARRQSYVDSKMADQQTQGQQMLDTLRLTPGVDPSAVPADPTASPLTPAPAPAPTSDAPLDTPTDTDSSIAPLNASPADINGLTPTSIGFDGNLGSATTPAPDTLLSPSPLSPSTTAPSLDGSLTSGIDPSLGSLNTGLNTNLDLSSSLNTGLTPDANSAPTIGLNSGLDGSFNSGLNSSLNSGLDSSLNSSLDSSLNSGLDSSLNSSLDSSFNSGLDSSLSSSGGLDSGLDSSSSVSDFGDSSLGGDSFSSGSFGGDMGPVVLDLSGQGIRINDLSDSHATFDADHNGVPNRIAWTTPDEGLLAFDANGSGTVDQTSELALRQWTPGAQTDLQGLRAFDTNHDGALDAGDQDFGRFDVWRDSNGNGVSDPGELSSLVEAGVSAISLASDGMQSRLPDGSTIYGQGSFTRTDGSSGRLADVALAFAPDINSARDQLVGAMAATPGGSAGVTAPMPPPAAPVGPMLGADIVSPLHARST